MNHVLRICRRKDSDGGDLLYEKLNMEDSSKDFKRASVGAIIIERQEEDDSPEETNLKAPTNLRQQ
jgi:hypothetical protein